MALDELKDWEDQVETEEKLNRDKGFNTLNAVNSLLAFIFRDGGHYVAKHGYKKAYRDAMERVAYLNGLLDTAETDMAGKPEFEQWLNVLRTK